jgi:hypothetical protein
VLPSATHDPEDSTANFLNKSMTENQYQLTRKVMASANYVRGKITAAKGEVAKWTKIEASYREQLKEGQANGAAKKLYTAMKRLEEVRKRFADIKLPNENEGITYKWVSAIDTDSYNYFPRKISESQFEKSEEEGLILYNTEAEAQNMCDQQNKI